jgi:hypothetical protein
MTAQTRVEIRPRTVGELLDDAWRLALADAPLLLALAWLFTVPALAALVLLLALPVPGWPFRAVLPALAALAWLLTGLGSGACQEVFRRRAEGQPATLGRCLGAAVRLGIGHMLGRAVALVLLLPGLACLGLVWWLGGKPDVRLFQMVLAPCGFFLVSGAVWLTHAIHPAVAANEAGPFGSLNRALSRELRRNSGKAAVVMASRMALYLLAPLNLHLVLGMVLWAAGRLGGLETAFADLLLSLDNPTYLVSLAGLSWLLLAPFAEAANYLLYLDARVRYDGLDLWYRVRASFPLPRNGAVARCVLAAVGLLLVVPAQAADSRRDVVREVRRDLQAVIAEVKAAQPYPGSSRYEPRVREMAERLKRTAGPAGRLRWLDEPLDGFGARSREGALEVLQELDNKMALLEESLPTPAGEEAAPVRRSRADIKSLLPGSDDATDDPRLRRPPPKEDPQTKRPVRREDPAQDGAGGSGVVVPSAGGGIGTPLWTALAGVLLAVVILALVLLWRRRGEQPQAPKPTGTLPAVPGPVEIEPERHSAAELWRRAETLAQKGDYLEAIRILYAGALLLLHEAGLIRYERTRTNGEYLGELRRADRADEMVVPFGGLTRLFELKWYGERDCRPDDYAEGRDLAAQLRQGVENR